MVLNHASIYLYNSENPDSPIELAFQEKYGPIVGYEWSADGNLIVGFSSGYLVAISTHTEKIGQVR